MSKMILKKLSETSWILENNQEKMAVVVSKPDSSIKLFGKINESFDNWNSFINKYNPNIVQTVQDNETEQGKIENLPVKHAQWFHVEKTPVPSYSKTENNTQRHAAGYYAVKSNSGWTGIFCPKISTLENSEYQGPYSSKLEVQHHVNSKNKIRLETDIVKR